MNNKLKIVFAGTPEIAKTVLNKMLENNCKPELVLTQPDRPAGRGMKLTPSPVKLLALEHEIEVFQPLSFKKDPTAITKIRELQPDIMIVVAYGLILPKELLDIPKLGCINIHVSLLPKWRGAAPIQRAVLAGDAESGVSIMQMDAGLDTGDVLLMEEISLAENETSGSLHDKLANLGAEMLIEFLSNPSAYARTKQSEDTVSYAHKLDKEEARIDWYEPAYLIERKVRGYNPFPGAFTYLDGQLHKIWLAEIEGNRKNSGEAGTIISGEKESLAVVCGDGNVLIIKELQEAGSKRKTVTQYLQGKPNLTGKQFKGE